MIHYRENDLTPDIINRIRTAVGWTAFSPAQLDRAVRGTAWSVTAWEKGRPAGMARLTGDGIYYLLCDVAVVPDAQNRGIGRELVRRLIEHARQTLGDGERCSIILVSADGKEPFYASLGFSPLPNGRAGYGMQLLLSPPAFSSKSPQAAVSFGNTNP